MKNMASFRITSFVCFYFALICLAPFFRTWSWMTAAVTALVLAVSFIGVRFKHVVLRIAVSLIPFIPSVWSLLSADYLTAAVCAIPAVLNAVTLIGAHAYDAFYRYRREFLVLSLVCFVLLVLSINPFIFSGPTCIYIGCYLFFGVLAMRAGRVGQFRSARWQAGNAGLFVLPIFLSAGVGVGLMIGFDRLIKWLSRFFLDEGVARASSSPSPIYADSIIKVEPSFEGFSTAVPLEFATEPPDTVAEIIASGLDWRWIAAGAVLLIACAVLVFLLLRKKEKVLTEQEKLDLDLERDIVGSFSRRRKNISGKDLNREKVRELYRRYMEFLRSKGIRILSNETTSDISDAAASVTEDDTALRSIYRLCRYDSDLPVTDEDVKLAEEVYMRLITFKKENDESEDVKPVSPPTKE